MDKYRFGILVFERVFVVPYHIDPNLAILGLQFGALREPTPPLLNPQPLMYQVKVTYKQRGPLMSISASRVFDVGRF